MHSPTHSFRKHTHNRLKQKASAITHSFTHTLSSQNTHTHKTAPSSGTGALTMLPPTTDCKQAFSLEICMENAHAHAHTHTHLHTSTERYRAHNHRQRQSASAYIHSLTPSLRKPHPTQNSAQLGYRGPHDAPPYNGLQASLFPRV